MLYPKKNLWLQKIQVQKHFGFKTFLSQKNLGANILVVSKEIMTVIKKKPWLKDRNVKKYQPSGAGGTRSPPATPHRLPVGPKMADGVWKGVESVVIGRYHQLLLNKFSYPSTPISTNQRP